MKDIEGQWQHLGPVSPQQFEEQSRQYLTPDQLRVDTACTCAKGYAVCDACRAQYYPGGVMAQEQDVFEPDLRYSPSQDAVYRPGGDGEWDRLVEYRPADAQLPEDAVRLSARIDKDREIERLKSLWMDTRNQLAGERPRANKAARIAADTRDELESVRQEMAQLREQTALIDWDRTEQSVKIDDLEAEITRLKDVANGFVDEIKLRDERIERVKVRIHEHFTKRLSGTQDEPTGVYAELLAILEGRDAS